jgi:pyruvate kinase
MHRANGRIVRATSPTEARERIKSSGGDILICPRLTEEYTPILRIVRGVICEGVSELPPLHLKLINPHLVWLTGVHNASRVLESGLSVTLDGKELLVYEGTI